MRRRQRLLGSWGNDMRYAIIEFLIIGLPVAGAIYDFIDRAVR